MALPHKFLLKTLRSNDITLTVNDKTITLRHVEPVGELDDWHLYECDDDCDTSGIIQAAQALPFVRAAQLNQAKRHAKRAHVSHTETAVYFERQLAFMNSTDIIVGVLDGDGGRISATFTWFNVAVAAAFILVNVAISSWMGLKLEGPLVISSIRCVIQLTIMGLILQDVFAARNPYYVAFLTAVLILLSTYETVYDKSERTWHGMFMSVLVNTAFSTLLVGIIGTRWAMKEKNFWEPQIFIPTVGLLLGITASSMAVSLDSCLTEVTKNQGRIETYLSYGATRFEAGRSIAIDAVRLAMLPTINRMSIVGLITIPGTMTGQILSGAPIMNAVRYQEIISFMISASSGIAVLGVVATCMHAVMDNKHRLRSERVTEVRIPILHEFKRVIINACKSTTQVLCGCCKRRSESGSDDERRPLISP